MLSDELQTQWDARYAESSAPPKVCQALCDYAHLLPTQGNALDFASGMGGNALLLAEHGLLTSAWDLSPVAIEKLSELASQRTLTVDAQARDLILNPPAENSFDVIVVSYFLERQLFPTLLAALKPSGLLFYETFVRDKPQGVGPSNPDYLLKQNELLRLCDGLVVRAYREEGLIGAMNEGCRNVAMFVGEKK